MTSLLLEDTNENASSYATLIATTRSTTPTGLRMANQMPICGH